MYQPYGPPNPYMMPPPPPPPMMGGQTTIIIQQKPQPAKITNIAVWGDLSHCAVCNQNTANIAQSRTSCVTITWCVFLLFVSAGILALVPFCC